MMENPFAVPPPLISRKRKTATSDASSRQTGVPFLSEETYHAYSVDGNAHESELFQREEAKRVELRTQWAAKNIIGKPASTAALPTTSTPSNRKIGLASMTLPFGPDRVRTAPATRPRPRQPQHLAAVAYERAVKENSRELALAQNIAHRMSALVIGDHCEYMRLYQKRAAALAGGIPSLLALTVDEHAALGKLEEAVKAEQVSFENDLERLARKEKIAEYLFVPPPINELYEVHLQTCRNQVMHLYPRYYEQLLSVPLNCAATTTAERTSSTMKHVKEVASHGSYPLLNEAALASQLCVDPQVAMDGGKTDAAAGDAWLAISADPTAERLMAEHNCDVAMSSSTLLAIFDTAVDENNTQSAGWTIPVKSRVCMVKGTSQRQLYLDRPLPNAHVTAREKIATATIPLAVHALTEGGRRGGGGGGGRVAYHVWQQGDTRMLIRTTTDAFLQDHETKAMKPVSVFVKPDHVPLGYDEQLTRREFRHLWLHSWIRGGGSAIVLGRVTPKSLTVTSWEMYSLGSLVRSLGSPGFPDTFEPLDFFVVLHTVLTTLQSLPTFNYLLQAPLRAGRNNHDRQLHISRAAMEMGMGIDQNQDQTETPLPPGHFDLYQYINTCGQPFPSPGRSGGCGGSGGDILDGYILPTCPLLPDQIRIPYTYQTGTHCPEFLQRGLCDKEADGEVCRHVHLRLIFTKNVVKWIFENHTLPNCANTTKNPVKPAAQRKKMPQVTPKFPFCRGCSGSSSSASTIQPATILANPKMVIKCDDPAICVLPHLTLHEIADRVADHVLRTVRNKRKFHKARNRAKANNWRDADGQDYWA